VPTLFKDANNNPCLKMALKEDAGNFYSKDVGIFSDPQKQRRAELSTRTRLVVVFVEESRKSFVSDDFIACGVWVREGKRITL